MNLVNWEPFREMEGFLNRFYGSPGRTMRIRGEGEAEKAAFDWRPTVDISETNKAYLIKADLPEVNRDDVEVSLDNGMLTISGERRFEREDESEEQHRVERMFGRFSRRFTLPADADAEHITAKSKDGVLKVTVPKMTATVETPIRISIE